MIKTAAQIKAELAAQGGDEAWLEMRPVGRPRKPVDVEDVPCPKGVCGGPAGERKFCRVCIGIRTRRRLGNRRRTPGLRMPRVRTSTRAMCEAVHESGARCTKAAHKTLYYRPNGWINARYPHEHGELTWM